MSTYKHIADERMIKAFDYIVAHKVKDVTTLKECCEIAGIAPNNIANIRKGTQSFNNNHILNICKHFNISADFIFGLTTNLFRQSAKETPIQRIESALQELKATKRK